MNPAFFDADLARIISYVTFDGHLSKTLSFFYLSSADWNALKDFERLVKEKFGLKPHYAVGTGFGESYKCIFYSRPVSRLLFSAGAPKGDKAVTPFRVPDWIKINSSFARVYLSTAFQCEGCISKNTDFNSYRLAFKMNKADDLLEDGVAFIQDLKALLSEFGIATTKIWTCHANHRKRDGKNTTSMVFCVRTKSIPVFLREIGFGVDSRKNKILSKASVVSGRMVKAYKNAFWLSDEHSPDRLPERWRVEIPEELDPNMAKLFAYLIKYGGVSSDLKQFYIASSSQEIVRDFAGVVYEKFKLRIPYARRRGRKYQCMACCLKIGKWLRKKGILPGREAITSFGVPKWIEENPENSEAFFKVLNS